MTDDATTPADLPITSALRAAIESQQQRVAGSPIGSQTRSLGQNIDALDVIVVATLAAVESLETELQKLRAG